MRSVQLSRCVALSRQLASGGAGGGTVPPVGTSGTAVRSVSEQWTAEALGSGSLPVFGTPALVALMEEAACVALQPFLGDSETSVGTGISTSHISATAVGSQVRARATLTSVAKKSLTFALVAEDTTGAVVGEGTHTRIVLSAEKFMGKLGQRKQTGFPSA